MPQAPTVTSSEKDGTPRAGWRRLPRNVRVLSGVSLLQDAASEMLYPVIPLFLTGTLGAPVAIVGLIEGVAEATAAIGKAISGRLADRFARKPLIALGYGISALSKPVIGLAGGWPLVLAARFGDRVGKGVRTSPRDALLAAETGPAERGAVFGFHRAADTLGAVLGPLVGLGLYELLDHRLRPLFFVAAVPALASVALIALVREHPKAPPPAPEAPRSLSPLPAGYWRLTGVLALFGLVNFTDALIILRAQELGLGSWVDFGSVPYEEMPGVFASASAMALMSQGSAMAALHLYDVPRAFWEEQFGLVLAEAMAVGTPVVATRVGGLPELVDDGVISGKQAKEVYGLLIGATRSPTEIVRERGMAVLSDAGATSPRCTRSSPWKVYEEVLDA